MSVGCGDETGTAGSGAQGNCESYCDKTMALQCAADDRATCLSDCRSGVEASAPDECPSQTSSYIGCLQTRVTFACDANGMATPDFDQVSMLCGAQYSAFAACVACLADANDSCDTCFKTNCCSELKAYRSDASLLALAACVQDCSGDLSCANDCENKYPGLRPKRDAATNCLTQQCSSC